MAGSADDAIAQMHIDLMRSDNYGTASVVHIDADYARTTITAWLGYIEAEEIADEREIERVETRDMRIASSDAASLSTASTIEIDGSPWAVSSVTQMKNGRTSVRLERRNRLEIGRNSRRTR